VLVELSAPRIRTMYDSREDEGHDDVFVSAVVEAGLGQHQAEGVEDRLGLTRHGEATLPCQAGMLMDQ
jgi:hypothetical protein